MNIVGLMLAEVGFGSSSAISHKISWNIAGVMVTSAIWKATLQPWLTTLAPVLISFSFRLDSDQRLIGSGVASVQDTSSSKIKFRRAG